MVYLQKSKSYKKYHYSVLNNFDFNYIHKRTFEMFINIVSILNKYGIDYVICGGTLLGAFTTNKFIPWDDDFDMALFDKDYDYAIKLLSKELDKNCFLQSQESDPNYYISWVKVRDKNSTVYPINSNFKHNGIWIDIYKLVKTNRLDSKKLIYIENLNYINRRFKLKGLSKSEYKFRLVELNKNHNKLSNSNNDKIKKLINEEVYIIMSASKVILDIKWIFPLTDILFEGNLFKTFNKPENYLVEHYGNNIFNLPPEKDRMISINKITYKL